LRPWPSQMVWSLVVSPHRDPGAGGASDRAPPGPVLASQPRAPLGNKYRQAALLPERRRQAGRSGQRRDRL
jgi:hypothetical protein